jgi:hypothetical protein
MLDDNNKPIMSNQANSKVPNGKVCYLEIPSENISESSSFYQKVFGWNIRTRNDGSTAFDDVPNGISGTWKLNRKPHSDSGLMIYIMVDDVAETLNSIISMGGKIVDPISGSAPEIVATFSDLSGNVFGIGQE